MVALFRSFCVVQITSLTAHSKLNSYLFSNFKLGYANNVWQIASSPALSSSSKAPNTVESTSSTAAK